MLCSCDVFIFFFFKQKTAYEMRISDWSSDVCSSDLEILQLGRQAEAMEEAEDQDGDLGVRLNPEQALEPAQVVHCLVDHRQTDDRVDQVRIDMDAAEHAVQQRQTVADSEQGHVDAHVAHPVQERSEEHTSELQSLMRISYAVFCLQKQKPY